MSKNGMLLATIFAFLIALAPLTFAHEASKTLTSDVQKLADQYNSNFDKVPDIVKMVAGTERANLHITYPDGDEVVIGAETMDGKIVSISDNPLSNPTINVYARSEVVDKILAADDPFTEAGKAVARNEVIYSGVGFFSKLKMWLIKFALSVLGFIIFPAAYQ